MSSATKSIYITPEEYLARERLAETKSEYYDGQINAMAGASVAHGILLMNLSGELYMRLKGGPCRPFSSDLRLAIRFGASYTYPDIMIICGEPRFADDEFDTILNPTVIIEILSPSTESWDRGGKFERYRAVDSLREYVLVSQDRRLVERFNRQEGEWSRTSWSLEGDTFVLESIGCQVPLAEIYRDVAFDPID